MDRLATLDADDGLHRWALRAPSGAIIARFDAPTLREAKQAAKALVWHSRRQYAIDANRRAP